MRSSPSRSGYFDAAGAGYLKTLYAAYRSPTVCGPTAPPPDVYVNESVAGRAALYQGVQCYRARRISPYIAVIPSYSINLAILEAASGRLDDGPSTTLVGAQLPNRPIHKATSRSTG